jgi:Metallo-beta-lactamase superfamily
MSYSASSRDMAAIESSQESGSNSLTTAWPKSGDAGPDIVRGMREVADGVFEVEILFVHAHLVVTDDGVVLVDTGLPGRSARIEQALHATRKAIGDVRTMLLTPERSIHGY